MTAPRPLRDDDRGVYTVELLGVLPYILMVAILAFQLALVGGVMNMAENAARTGSRMVGMGGNGTAAAISAVDPNMQGRARVSVDGPTVTVAIDVPVVIPFVDLDLTTIERSATLPNTTIGGG